MKRTTAFRWGRWVLAIVASLFSAACVDWAPTAPRDRSSNPIDSSITDVRVHESSGRLMGASTDTDLPIFERPQSTFSASAGSSTTPTPGSGVTPPSEAIAALWDASARVVSRVRTDYVWPGALAYQRAKSLPGAIRGIEYARKVLGCNGAPRTSQGIRTQEAGAWWPTSGNRLIDTIEFNAIPLNCDRHPRGASAALLINEIRNRTGTTAVRLAFRQFAGGPLEELQPDGTIARAKLGDAVIRTPVLIMQQLAPRLGNAAAGALEATKYGTVIDSWRALLDDNHPSDLSWFFAPWASYSYLANLENDVPGFFHPMTPKTTYRPAPERHWWDDLLELLTSTVSQLKTKLPDKAVDFILSYIFG